MKTFKIPVIFLTAYSDDPKLFRALETNPYGYITKPFEEADLKVNLYLTYEKYYNKTVLNKDQYVDNGLFLKKDHQYVKYDPEDIYFVMADGSYTMIFTRLGTITLAINLNKLQQKIDYEPMIRVHRSYLVNFNKIECIDHDKIFIKDYQIPIGRSYKDQLFKKMKFI